MTRRTSGSQDRPRGRSVRTWRDEVDRRGRGGSSDTCEPPFVQELAPPVEESAATEQEDHDDDDQQRLGVHPKRLPPPFRAGCPKSTVRVRLEQDRIRGGLGPLILTAALGLQDDDAPGAMTRQTAVVLAEGRFLGGFSLDRLAVRARDWLSHGANLSRFGEGCPRQQGSGKSDCSPYALSRAESSHLLAVSIQSDWTCHQGVQQRESGRRWHAPGGVRSV